MIFMTNSHYPFLGQEGLKEPRKEAPYSLLDPCCSLGSLWWVACYEIRFPSRFGQRPRLVFVLLTSNLSGMLRSR